MKIVLKDVRLAFPNIWEPKAMNPNDAPRCGANLIFNAEESKANYKAVVDAILKVAQEKWKDQANAILKSLNAKAHVCLHKGEEKAKYAGFEGNVYVSASNKVRPMVIDRQRNPLMEKDGVIYAGCYVNASVDIWAQDNNYGKKVNATLLAVQFVRDGEAFAGGERADVDDFEDIGGDESSDDSPF